MKQYSLAKTLPVVMAFYVMGFGDIVGTAINYTQQEFDISNTLIQVLTFMAFVWFFLLSVPVGVFQDKNSKKLTVIIGILFFAASSLAPLLSHTFYGMLASFTLLGIGNAIIQTSTNPLMQDVSPPDKLSRNLTMAQFVKAIAGMFGPVIATFCATRFGNWMLIYWVYLSICIISLLWLQFTPIRELSNTGRASFSSTIKLLRNRKVAFLVLGTFLMVGFDVGMNINIPKYLMTRFSVNQDDAIRFIFIYFAALMIGRFLSAIILNKLQGKKMLLYCAVLSVVSFALLYFMPNLFAGKVAIFSIGLFTAAIFPLIFSAGLQYMPERANELSGLMIMSVCGGGIIPPVVGALTDFSGLMIALTLPGACLIYVIFLALYMIKS
jgi:fucose permease